MNNMNSTSNTSNMSNTTSNANSMGSSDNTVVAVYDSSASARNAQQALLDAGFARSDIRMSSEDEAASSASASGTTGAGRNDDDSGFLGFFRSLFGTDDGSGQHDAYAESVRRGNCVLTVNASSADDADRAAQVMERFSPVDIDERASHWRQQGWSGYDATAPRYSEEEAERERASYGLRGGGGNGLQADPIARTDDGSRNLGTGSTANTLAAGSTAREGASTGDTTRIPVVEEELKVGKRDVQRGGVRVFKRVREVPVHEQVTLREERVSVERHPVNKPATAADMAAFKEGSMELRETDEEAVTSKSARVVEEVVVGKQVSQRTEDINDTVRRTDVDVEQLGAGSARAGMAMDDADDYRRHWQSAYGSSGGRYEDYDDAYRYGAQRASDGRLQHYRWEEAEPQMRSDWESSHPGGTWDKVKDAVRYGAERVSGNRRH